MENELTSPRVEDHESQRHEIEEVGAGRLMRDPVPPGVTLEREPLAEVRQRVAHDHKLWLFSREEPRMSDSICWCSAPLRARYSRRLRMARSIASNWWRTKYVRSLSSVSECRYDIVYLAGALRRMDEIDR